MEEQIKLFLNSDLDEADYFSLSKENLLTLRELLLQFKKIDNEFTSAIQEQFQSIKEKCNWLSTISFSGYIHKNGFYGTTSIYLNSEDGIDLTVQYNDITHIYEGLIKEDKIPKVCLISRKLRKHLLRQKDISFIQEELYEIDRIGRDIYKSVLVPINSVSKNFCMCYVPHKGLHVTNNDKYNYYLIATYYECLKGHKERELLKDEKSKEKLLTRILVNQNIK